MRIPTVRDGPWLTLGGVAEFPMRILTGQAQIERSPGEILPKWVWIFDRKACPASVMTNFSFLPWVILFSIPSSMRSSMYFTV